MVLILLAYIGGVLTIVSPCILPVLPFVFASADRPFAKGGLPMLVGMAVTIALVASLAAVAGGWAVEANRWGRVAAMAVLAMFGLMLVFPQLSARLFRPAAELGARLTRSAGQEREGGVVSSLLLGVATGLLWVPCAGPLLGLILTGAAIGGANVQTTALLFAYAAGAATSLGLALLIGGRVFAAMKRSLGAGEWIRRGVGAAVLAGVAAIGFGLDTGVLARLSLSGTTAIEQGLLDAFHPQADAPPVAMAPGPAMMAPGPAMMAPGPAMMAGPEGGAPAGLVVEGEFPPLDGATQWLNSPPLSVEALKGKVVLVDFWTYSCINCLRAIPYVRAWAEKYKDRGLVVIGVHTPEFAFEKHIGNVEKASADLGITYPVAIDNDYAIWRAFDNRYWPAHYFIDAEGRVRHHKFGEGGYEESERVIQTLLAEAGDKEADAGVVDVRAEGAQAAADMANVRSPETYVGYGRAENFVSPGGMAKDAAKRYGSGDPRLNEWGLDGDWTVHGEHAALDTEEGGIVFRFHARDLHLVLGPGPDGAPVRFTVTLDGAQPGEDHGVDVDAAGNGVVSEQRLYQLVRQNGDIRARTFEIRFHDPGVEAYAFTFG